MKRLEAIISQIEPCDIFADIGSDHGLIAQSALKFAKKVIVTDISEKCLSKARSLLGDCSEVVFSAGDGLKALGDYIDAVDCIAICGMGGRTICGIIKGYDKNAKLILQPQNDVSFVREFISRHSFVILHDFLAYERGKFYDIIVCRRGKSEKLSKLQLNFGKFYNNKDELNEKRLAALENKYVSYPSTAKNAEFLSLIRKALDFQKD